jgi:maltose O-acetyltransferase
MKQELTLQRASAADAEVLSDIAVASKSHWNYPKRWMEAWKPQLTIPPEYIQLNETWLAKINDEPAGFYALIQQGSAGWLDHLWVLPSFIGQGLGGFLLTHALTRCRKLSIEVLNIESDPNAAGFYEKMGAHRVGERPTEVCGEPRSLPILEMRP